jgi:hypothetical protein
MKTPSKSPGLFMCKLIIFHTQAKNINPKEQEGNIHFLIQKQKPAPYLVEI